MHICNVSIAAHMPIEPCNDLLFVWAVCNCHRCGAWCSVHQQKNQRLDYTSLHARDAQSHWVQLESRERFKTETQQTTNPNAIRHLKLRGMWPCSALMRRIMKAKRPVLEWWTKRPITPSRLIHGTMKMNILFIYTWCDIVSKCATSKTHTKP